MVLGQVIDALVQKRSHVPFYESKLTMLLQPALGGATRTTVVVTASPDRADAEETLHSLRFGERCSRITNQLSVATSSVAGALAAIDASLRQCEEGLRSLQARGVGGAVAAKLQERRDRMRLKRKDLARLQDHPVPGATVASA